MHLEIIGHSKVNWCHGSKRGSSCYGMTKKGCCNNKVMGNGSNYEIGKWKVDVYHYWIRGSIKRDMVQDGGAFGSHLNSQKGGT